MSNDLLSALDDQEPDDEQGVNTEFSFQHRLCHDLESLIWVVVYAMMIRRRNALAATDPTQFTRFQAHLGRCWGGHSHAHLWSSHSNVISAGCSVTFRRVERSWFPDPHEAAFFRDAMRLVRGQAQDGIFITYEGLSALLQKHIRLAQDATNSTVTSG